MSAKLILVIVAVVVLVGAGLFMGYKIGSPGGGPTDQTVVDSGVIDQVLKISELGTIAYHTAAFEMVEHRSKAATLNWLADADYDLCKFWQGRVKAGITLDKTHVTVKPAGGEAAGSKGTVEIALPAAVILSAEPDSIDGFRFFIRWTGTFGKPPTDDAKASWANEGPGKLRASATKNGIEKEAANRAKEILTSYVAVLGYKVSFVDLPPSPPSAKK